jgi:hypothetical protein
MPESSPLLAGRYISIFHTEKHTGFRLMAVYEMGKIFCP